LLIARVVAAARGRCPTEVRGDAGVGEDLARGAGLMVPDPGSEPPLIWAGPAGGMGAGGAACEQSRRRGVGWGWRRRLGCGQRRPGGSGIGGETAEGAPLSVSRADQCSGENRQ
jgi:hypothetical protein